jgi:hypothetical protein
MIHMTRRSILKLLAFVTVGAASPVSAPGAGVARSSNRASTFDPYAPAIFEVVCKTRRGTYHVKSWDRSPARAAHYDLDSVECFNIPELLGEGRALEAGELVIAIPAVIRGGGARTYTYAGGTTHVT